LKLAHDGQTFSNEVAKQVQNIPINALATLRRRHFSKYRLAKNDVEAVELLVKESGDDVLYYHPQIIDEEGNIEQHLRLAILPKFGRELLALLGRGLIFMDAVYGTNQYGFPMMTWVVRDEFGHGNPVGMCIASAENAEHWEEFMRAALTEAGFQPEEWEKLTFMIDKSSTEIAAIRSIGALYLLCHFHMLQEGLPSHTVVNSQSRKNFKVNSICFFRAFRNKS